MKRVGFLGAALFQVAPIQFAKSMGCYVVTIDNVPSNPGHLIADKFYNNVSTVDIDLVEQVAEKENLDLVLCYGSDVSAYTAAIVSERLDLQVFVASETVKLLTEKDKFRDFLDLHNLQRSVNSRLITSKNIDYVEPFSGVHILKPIDSSGSKGTFFVNNNMELKNVFSESIKFSRSESAILEDYILKKSFQICGDGYMEGGKLVDVFFGNGHFYDHSKSFAPFAETFPAIHSEQLLAKVKAKLELVLRKAGFLQGVFNLDVIVDEDDEPFIIEIGPRSGGNFIPEAIELHSGINLVKKDLCFKLGLRFEDVELKTKRNIASYMLHSKVDRIVERVIFPAKLESNIVRRNYEIDKSFSVNAFRNARDTFGNIILCFNDYDDMIDSIDMAAENIVYEN